MSEEEFQANLQKLEALLRTPVQLDFRQAHLSDLAFKFPEIRSERTMGSHTIGTEATRFFALASRHFRFDDFFNPTAKELMAWPCERMRTQPGSASDHMVVSKPIGQRRFALESSSSRVNYDEKTAVQWFVRDIIEPSAASKHRHCFVLRGEPGSGKSTFIKFLINECRNESKKHSVVFSRFEASKYFAAEKASIKDSQLSSAQLSCLSEKDRDRLESERVNFFLGWLTRLALRDLIVDQAFLLDGNRLVKNKNSMYFGSSTAIQTLIQKATQGIPEKPAHTSLFTAIMEMVDTQGFQGREIMAADWEDSDFHEGVIAVVNFLSRAKRVFVVFDGLDYLGVEDFTLDHSKYFILDNALRLFGGTDAPPKLGRTFQHALFILRDNTYQIAIKNYDFEVRRDKITTHLMEPLDHRVVLFKSLGRACDIHFKNETSAVRIEWQNRSYRAIRLVISCLALKLSLSRSDQALLSIFNGNIRDCFEYFSRVLNWMIDEEYDAGHRPDTRMDDLFTFVKESARKSFMRSKSYRLVEMLLRSKYPYFMNRIATARLSSQEESAMPDKRYKLQKHVRSEAFVDNIFNYVLLRREDNGVHYLMLKIRILQILDYQRAPNEAFLDILRKLEQVGYIRLRKQELWDVLVILQHDGFVSMQAMLHAPPDVDEQYAFTFSMMPKGRCVLRGLVFDSAYWEHVFHQTLLPAPLLHDGYDLARVDGVKKWERQSLRNCFVMLQYLMYVENYNPKGTSLPEEYKISGRVADSLWKSVRGIVTRNFNDLHRTSRKSSAQEWLVHSAIEDAQHMITAWQRHRLCLTKH